MKRPSIDRRTFLKDIVIAATTVAALGNLAACAPAEAQRPSASASETPGGEAPSQSPDVNKTAKEYAANPAEAPNAGIDSVTEGTVYAELSSEDKERLNTLNEMSLQEFLIQPQEDIDFYGGIYEDTYRTYTEAVIRRYDDKTLSVTTGKYDSSLLDEVFTGAMNADKDSTAQVSLDNLIVRSSITLLSLTKNGALETIIDNKREEAKKAAGSQYFKPNTNTDYVDMIDKIDDLRFISTGANAPGTVDNEVKNYGFYVSTLGKTIQSPREMLTEYPSHVMYVYGSPGFQATTAYIEGGWREVSIVSEDRQGVDARWVDGIGRISE